MFQSLFLWNSRPDFGGAENPCGEHVVSILVFVELAPGRVCSTTRAHGAPVSILVFVELAPGR